MADRDGQGPGIIKSLLNSFKSSGGKQQRDEEEAAIAAAGAAVNAEEAEWQEALAAAGEEVAQPEPEDENLLLVKDSPLYELYMRQTGMPPVEDEAARFHLSVFMAGGEAPEREQRGWLKALEREASSRLAKSRAEEEKPLPALAVVNISGDRMAAWLFVFPPLFDGEALTPEAVQAALAAKGVAYGIDEEKLAAFCADPQYFSLFPVARGTPPVDGADGEIIDKFKREHEIQLTVKDDNTIDYKDLGWLQTVLTDEVICEVIPPTEATHGTNVRGDEARGRNGRKAIAPKGQNTRMNEEETALVAAIDGVLTFASGRFRVDPLLVINGNVDGATGNLNVVGDVLINGDILEGFTVEATGNITVQGMIEGAHVLAGGNIQVGRGMNGNSHGNLEAKGNVLSKFIENGSVTAGGKLICDTIINSTVSSDDAIEVKTGRGAIIGGSITALERIDAKTVGNQSNRSIVITMGSTANFLREKHELEQKRKDVAAEVEELTKNIGFLGGPKQSKTAEMSKMLDDMKLKLTVQKMQLANLDRRLIVMNRKQVDASACRLRAEVIYPPVQITIGSFTKILRQTAFNALVYCKHGEVQVANV